MEKIRLLVADDHPIFLDGFCELVHLKYAQIEIVASVSNGEEAVKKEAELNPDVVLLDIRMPVMDGVEAAGIIKRRRPDAKIIMLTTFNERNLISGALKAGAMGYILKETPVSEVVQDVVSVYNGNYLISAQAAEKLEWLTDQALEESLSIDPARVTNSFFTESRIRNEGISQLTRRENQILKLMLLMRTNTEIAEKLGISERTVRNYVSKIYEILGVHDRLTLINRAANQRAE